MQIQWFPGHMARARRLLGEQIRRVDLIIELCDARLPYSSRNPDLMSLARGKKRLLVMNKSDLADENLTQQWLGYFRSQQQPAFAFNAAKGRAADAVKWIDRLMADTVARQAERGVRKTVRAMVIGVPNVGKSTFINRLNGTPVADAADRPGVTRANRWVRISPYLELLDTPGLLWPRLDDAAAASRLAWLGTIRDEILDTEALSISLLESLLQARPKAVMERFKVQDASLRGVDLLEAVCRGRGFLMSGGVCNTERGASVVLDEFRAGKLGRITLETPAAKAEKENVCENPPSND